MNTRTRWIFTTLLLLAVLCIAGTKISQLTKTTTFNEGDTFLVNTNGGGQVYTRAIEATDLVEGLHNLGLARTNDISPLDTNSVQGIVADTLASGIGDASFTTLSFDAMTGQIDGGTNILIGSISKDRVDASFLAWLESLGASGFDTNANYSVGGNWTFGGTIDVSGGDNFIRGNTYMVGTGMTNVSALGTDSTGKVVPKTAAANTNATLYGTTSLKGTGGETIADFGATAISFYQPIDTSSSVSSGGDFIGPSWTPFAAKTNYALWNLNTLGFSPGTILAGNGSGLSNVVAAAVSGTLSNSITGNAATATTATSATTAGSATVSSYVSGTITNAVDTPGNVDCTKLISGYWWDTDGIGQLTLSDAGLELNTGMFVGPGIRTTGSTNELTGDVHVGGTLYANTMTNVTLNVGTLNADYPTNSWTADSTLALGGTNFYYTAASGTHGITGIVNLPGSKERFGQVTLGSTGDWTFTNIASIHMSDFKTSRVITNGNFAVVGIQVIPGIVTNGFIVQTK